MIATAAAAIRPDEGLNYADCVTLGVAHCVRFVSAQALDRLVSIACGV